MSITSYSELQAAVADWTNRSDLTTVIPDFIRLAELDFEPSLRASVLRADIELASGEDVVPLPADVGELRSIRIATDTYRHTLKMVTPEALADYRKATSGVPQWAAIVGTDVLLDCAPDSDLDAEIIYYEKLVPLSDDVTTNSTLDEAPNVYLYGALAQAETYLEHDERLALWQTRLAHAVQDLNNRREARELGAAPRAMRIPVAIG